jgi:hypothetical protein
MYVCRYSLILYTESPNTMSEELLYWFGVLTVGVILSVNIPVLWVVRKISSPTLINKLIGVDCIIGLAYIPGILVVIGVSHDISSVYICSFRVCYSFFVSFLNRLLPVGIVTYRYVYVCKSHWVQTGSQRKIFQNSITLILLGLVVGLTCGCFLYREKYLHFWACMGQEGFSKSQGYTGMHFLLPIYNPFHLLSVLVFFIHSLVLPIGYLAIYFFRKQQDSLTSGLTDKSRNSRKNRNIVTAKINAIIWLSEFCSYLVLLPQNNIFFVLYFLVSGTVSPILYYSGIEANRKAAQEHIRDMFKESKKTKIDETKKQYKNDNCIHHLSLHGSENFEMIKKGECGQMRGRDV